MGNIAIGFVFVACWTGSPINCTQANMPSWSACQAQVALTRAAAGNLFAGCTLGTPIKWIYG